MSLNKANFSELDRLLNALCEDRADTDDIARIEQLARDEESLLYILDYLQLDGLLRWENGTLSEETPAQVNKADVITSPPDIAIGDKSIIQPSFLNTFFDYCSSSWPVAYTVSAVIVGVALFIASLIYLPEPTKQFAQSGDNDNAKIAATAKGQSDQKRPASADQAMQFVGRITGMVDCEFSDENTIAVAGASVPLGRKYALARGLMEITYNSGAKVILQGPCQYEVNDPAGGFLSLGKLTARIEKKNEVGSGQGAVDSGQGSVNSGKWSVARESVELQNSKNSRISEAGSKSGESDPQPQIKKSLFTVRTPSAIITDLGTEFGVNVDNTGRTISRVFSGSVQVRLLAGDGKSEGNIKTLQANQTVVISPDKNGKDNIIKIVPPEQQLVNFVRELPRPITKTIDLADIVAGGDGFSGRRNAGISVTDGRPIEDASKLKAMLTTDGRYCKIDWSPYIDGVFLLDGRKGSVQVDSSGHVFGGFPACSPQTLGHVWVGKSYPLISGFTGPQKDSREFRYKYEMDVLPSQQDLDGNGVKDFELLESKPGNITVSNGVMTIIAGTGSEDCIKSLAKGSLWKQQFTPGTDYTVEFSAKILSAPGGQDGYYGALLLYASTDHFTSLRIGADHTKLVEKVLSKASNMDDFHVFRLVRQGSRYYVWRDGNLICDSQLLDKGDYRFTFGDYCGAILGSSLVDYLRLEPGAYAPVSKSQSAYINEMLFPAKLEGIDYTSAEHNVLWLTSNKGITFDLDAIRQARAGAKLLKFRTTAGICDKGSTEDRRIDVWVLLDGQVCYRRREVNRNNRPMSINVPLTENARFLTLVVTDGGDDIKGDIVLFIDPRVELSMLTEQQ